MSLPHVLSVVLHVCKKITQCIYHLIAPPYHAVVGFNACLPLALTCIKIWAYRDGLGSLGR